MNELLADELLGVEAEWNAARRAADCHRRRLLEAPPLLSPFVWSPMASLAVDPMRQRAADQAIAVAARKANLERLPAVRWFSAESDASLRYYVDHGGLDGEMWTTRWPIESCVDAGRWEVRLHIDVDLDDIGRLVTQEIEALANRSQ